MKRHVVFVDCAIVSNADFIVSEDNHFNVLNKIPFPHIVVKRLQDFYEELVKNL